MKITEALLLAFDTETTGPDAENDRVVELGAAYVLAGRPHGAPLRTLVDPGQYIPAGATQVHGIKNEDVAGAPRWPDVAPGFRAHLRSGAIPCGYNLLSFDCPLIHAENRRHGVDWTIPVALDPYVFAAWHHRGDRSRKLGAMCEAYGITLPEDRAHSADADALAAGMLVVAMARAGVIPDDVEVAFAEQQRLQAVLAEENGRYGRYLYCDRADGRMRVGLGKHAGSLLEEADAEYLKWMLGRPDIPEEARAQIARALGQVEQMGLF
jgi:DNA polymerase III epsilon subunit-like protein